MKKTLLALLVLLLTISVFAQKTIDKPDFGSSNLPGNITKIEQTADATILYVAIKFPPGVVILIPKEAYIQDINSDKKLFVIKTEGIPLAENYTMPPSGEANYKFYFPKLNDAVKTIDFAHGDSEGEWFVSDIVINEQATMMPKALRGNWFLTDGSNQWDYGFYPTKAVVDKAVWIYKAVEKKQNTYTIVLERNGKIKKLYAQINPKGGVNWGSNVQKMQNYSTAKTENPDYRLKNDDIYTEAIFKLDTATYSGVIKGYSSRKGQKTGQIFVNNVFTSNQDSYLVKIDDDGSFSVKFPVAYPQYIVVQLGNTPSGVFVEPGKETFHLIDGERSLFMGDGARTNNDLKALDFINFWQNRQQLETALKTSSQEYKNTCLAIKNKQLEDLQEFIKKHFVSQKALQLKKLDIEYMVYQEILGYEMEREHQDILDASFYDFITPAVLENVKAVMTSGYSGFINRLMYANIFRGKGGVTFDYNSPFSSSKLFQKYGITLTKEELEMATANKEVDELMIKTIAFQEANYFEIEKFTTKYKEAYIAVQKEKAQQGYTIDDITTHLEKQGVVLTAEDKQLVGKIKSSEYTAEEKAISEQFYNKYKENVEAFYKKYETRIAEIKTEESAEKLTDKMKDFFGLKEAFSFDVVSLQKRLGYLERTFTPFTDFGLKLIQANIKHPFLSHYAVVENDKIKAKIEANKSKKEGFAINTVKKTEGDGLFESMIAKFKGKVIYVDFWATWCSPCREGIKEIAPLKEEMKNQEVVFLYITDQSSPEKTWANSIPDIKGEHYRVTKDEWNYLSEKFHISGIPHYALVNKKGEIVNPELGHNTNEAVKRILEEQLK
jgi:thiol-disulfide isomerase/thioredoxin